MIVRSDRIPAPSADGDAKLFDVCGACGEVYTVDQARDVHCIRGGDAVVQPEEVRWSFNQP